MRSAHEPIVGPATMFAELYRWEADGFTHDGKRVLVETLEIPSSLDYYIRTCVDVSGRYMHLFEWYDIDEQESAKSVTAGGPLIFNYVGFWP